MTRNDILEEAAQECDKLNKPGRYWPERLAKNIRALKVKVPMESNKQNANEIESINTAKLVRDIRRFHFQHNPANTGLAAGFDHILETLGCDCQNPAQCWEPCGELGQSEEHARKVENE